MEKKTLLFFGLAVIIFAGGIIWWGIRDNTLSVDFNQNVTTYFYGQECPHCQKVSAFIDENKVAEKFSFEKREVWHDTSNASLMRTAAKICSLSSDQVAVPFIFSEGKCIIGETQAIDFFKQKVGI